MTRPHQREPRRFQRERGMPIPRGAVYVGRPTVWGNPFDERRHGDSLAVDLFEDLLDGDRTYLRDHRLTTYPSDEEIRRRLRGRDLVCWCPTSVDCHASILLEIANEE